MLKGAVKANRISAKISQAEELQAIEYIKGAVHDHCKNLPYEDLSVRIMFGEVNKDWNGTPIQAIYDYHFDSVKKRAKYATRTPDEQKKIAKNNAAKDVGWLLKKVLIEDRRSFYLSEKDTGARYHLV